MKKIIFLLLLVSSDLIAQEQNIITGHITNNNNEPLIGASVVLYSEKDSTKIISYSIADENGNFKIKHDQIDGYFLSVSYLGYEREKVELSKGILIYDVKLEESSKRLSEIIIKATEIRDTIQLKQDTLKFSKDAKLKEILKDNEGIEINDDNGLTFMGVPINKILINKKEVFVNQNSVALENISNEMIDNIQIINNYKDKFNIDFDNFNEMVLNVDTKDNFTGVLRNILEAGAGIDNAYLLGLNSYVFSDKFNVFLTQNTNTVLERPHNINEIRNRYNNSSSFYNKNLSFNTSGLSNVKEDLFNNTYLIIKKENLKSKIEANLGFNYTSQIQELEKTISHDKARISTESISNKNMSHMFYGDLGMTLLVSDQFSVNIHSNIDKVNSQPEWKYYRILYSAENEMFINQINTVSNNFITENALNTRKIINDNWLWESRLEHFHEKIDEVYLSDDSGSLLDQEISYRINNTSFESSLFYQKSNLLNFGTRISLKTNQEAMSSKRDIETNLNRKFEEIETSLIVRGQNISWNYFLTVGSELLIFRNQDKPGNKIFFPVSLSLNYKFSSKKSINVSFENNYGIENLENSLDTLLTNTAEVILSNDLSQNMERNQNFVLNYNIIDIPKSSNLSFLIAGSMANSFSQTSFTDFDSIANIYRRNVFDNRRTLFVKNRYSKGFYFSKEDHRIQIGYSISYSWTDSELFQNSVLSPLFIEQGDLYVTLAFIPQNFIINEIELLSNHSMSKFYINESSINNSYVNDNYLTLSKNLGDHIFSLGVYDIIYKTSARTFHRRDLDFSYRYHMNKNSSVFIKAKSALTLLGIQKNNVGNIINTSINGVNTVVRNNNILGYLIAGIQLKF